MVESILPFAHRLLKEALHNGGLAVDATIGNGHDTVKLAEWTDRVIGFDIQVEAINATRRRLVDASLLDNVTLYNKSHAEIDTILEEQNVQAAVFNLGYLPGGDKSIVTTPESTIHAIKALQNHLLPGGLIVLVVYPGHPEGKIEADALLKFASQLDQRHWHVTRYERLNQKSSPPFVVAIEKAHSK